jgi:hypothetical protein
MERWNVGTNSVYKDGSVYREVGPWYVFLIEWLTGWAGHLAWKFPEIPLPAWHVCSHCLLGNSYLEKNEVTTLKQEYGDLATMFHVKVCNRLFQWCFKRYKTSSMSVDIDSLLVFDDSGCIKDQIDCTEEDLDPKYKHPKFAELEALRKDTALLWERRAKLKKDIIRLMKYGDNRED